MYFQLNWWMNEFCSWCSVSCYTCTCSCSLVYYHSRFLQRAHQCTQGPGHVKGGVRARPARTPLMNPAALLHLKSPAASGKRDATRRKGREVWQVALLQELGKCSSSVSFVSRIWIVHKFTLDVCTIESINFSVFAAFFFQAMYPIPNICWFCERKGQSQVFKSENTGVFVQCWVLHPHDSSHYYKWSIETM